MHSTHQLDLAKRRLRLNSSKMQLLAYQVDAVFWAPDDTVGDEPLICSAGLEYRDYPTLLAAVRDLPVDLMIAAGSRWSRHASGLRAEEIPNNVQVTSLDYTGLRDLYRRSRFVVVPLRPVENQAGITTILEAMSIGKAVIVTATNGQCDIVRGRLCGVDGSSNELHGDPAVFGLPADLAAQETGLYVPPGDAQALRAAIEYLLAHPEKARQMGAAGRRVVERGLTIERFTERFADLITGTTALDQPACRAEMPESMPLSSSATR
jgi:glycosyltransferase involved in cell wall biosynthesis